MPLGAHLVSPACCCGNIGRVRSRPLSSPCACRRAACEVPKQGDGDQCWGSRQSCSQLLNAVICCDEWAGLAKCTSDARKAVGPSPLHSPCRSVQSLQVRGHKKHPHLRLPARKASLVYETHIHAAAVVRQQQQESSLAIKVSCRWPTQWTRAAPWCRQSSGGRNCLPKSPSLWDEPPRRTTRPWTHSTSHRYSMHLLDQRTVDCPSPSCTTDRMHASVSISLAVQYCRGGRMSAGHGSAMRAVVLP